MTKASINYRALIRILCVITSIVGLSMIIPWIYAEVTGDADCALAFKICTPPTVILGACGTFFFKSSRAKFRAREGYLTVALCWILASFVGAFPYMLSDFTGSFINAFFESVSGFTTTGCSAVAGTVLPKSLILWKAISNWLGGMGILVFVISILPALGINGQMIARAETPGPVLEKMTVRISDSAKILYITYISFTISEFALLLLSCKMSVFDAIVNTMGSISTGGLLAQPEGVAYYDSFYVEVVMSVFCILASVNFILYHYLITGKISYLIKDIELRAYFIIICAAIIICTGGLMFYNGADLDSSFRDAFFQVISMATTAGYIRSPGVLWPVICQVVLLSLMFIGGCGASTAGSVKVIRVLVMMKLIGRGCLKRLHPRSVVAVKLGKESVPAPVVSGITAFILTYVVMLLMSTIILSFQGVTLETAILSSLAMMSNTGGAALGDAGVLGDFSIFHPLLRLYLSGLMILGRLELFTVIVLFTRNFWGKDR